MSLFSYGGDIKSLIFQYLLLFKFRTNDIYMYFTPVLQAKNSILVHFKSNPQFQTYYVPISQCAVGSTNPHYHLEKAM